MYLLNAETTIEWELLATATPPLLADLDLVIIDPHGDTTYLNAPIDGDDYTAPTSSTVGKVVYRITPSKEGLYRIRLVTGTANSYSILSKVEMMVFDNNTTTSPYAEVIGEPLPYDINFYAQGYVIPNEVCGVFIASRTISILEDAPGSYAKALRGPLTVETTFNIMKDDNFQVGTIFFGINEFVGVIQMDPTVLLSGDRLSLIADSAPADINIRDISVNIVGCCMITPCTVS